ncbi:MAG TPA: DNA polymerase III subunit beta [Cyanobacteria bacterium UBA8530]|nr:DNA polymerase III subunit beta [Cyanobacteria bacterium UBA8530]
MEFVCNKENLMGGVQSVQRAVSHHGPMPILSNLLMVASSEGLEITATDLEVGIKAIVPAQVKIEGSITLAAKQLSEIVGKLPNSEIRFEVEGSRAVLFCAKSRFVLPGIGAEDFPALPEIDSEIPPVSLEANKLLRGIKQTTFAAARDDKSVISGISFKIEGGELEIAATDGYRLAIKRYPVEGATDLKAIIPARSMNELARMLNGGDLVSLSLAQNQVLFDFGDRYLTSRLIDGQYPNYRQIVPPSFAYQAQIDRASLLSSVERVSIMASEREAKVIKLRFSQGQIELKANAADLGESDEILEIDYEGEEMTVSFNSVYLTESLRAMEGETLLWSMNTAIAQTKISSSDDQTYSYILMPIRG